MSTNTNIIFFISTSMVGPIRRVKSGLLEEFQVTSGVKPYALNWFDDTLTGDGLLSNTGPS